MMTVVVCLLFLIPATIAAVYYVILTGIGWRAMTRQVDGSPRTRFAILIPAHDEESVLADTSGGGGITVSQPSPSHTGHRRQQHRRYRRSGSSE